MNIICMYVCLKFDIKRSFQRNYGNFVTINCNTCGNIKSEISLTRLDI